VRAHVFSTGRVRPKREATGVRRYFVNDWANETLPVNVFLIEHPDGLCLVDAGQTARSTRAGYFPGWYPFFRLSRFELSPTEEAAQQVVAAGFDVQDVRWVVLTHMHTDHVGGIGAFRGAEVVVTRREWERARGFRGRLRGYLPQYWPDALEPRTVEFTGPALGPFPGSFDVSRDGRLVLVPFPGHTLGHAALFARSDADGSLLFVGDAVLRASELDAVAPEVAAWCREHAVGVLAAHDDGAALLLRDRIAG
jgi:N-acyl homoserine lactone hydrolase